MVHLMVTANGKDAANGRAPEDGRGQLVGKRAVADILDTSMRTVERLVARGELAAPVHVGRSAKWFRADVDAYLERLRANRATMEMPRC